LALLAYIVNIPYVKNRA